MDSSNTYLIEILKPVAYMPTDMYIQEATLSYDKQKFYISRGPRGRMTIGVKSVRIIHQIKPTHNGSTTHSAGAGAP